MITAWLIGTARALQPEHDRAFYLVILAGMDLAIVGDFLNLDMGDTKAGRVAHPDLDAI